MRTKVGAILSDGDLAGAFSAGAAEHGIGVPSGLDPRELPGWGAVEASASRAQPRIFWSRLVYWEA